MIKDKFGKISIGISLFLTIIFSNYFLGEFNVLIRIFIAGLLAGILTFAIKLTLIFLFKNKKKGNDNSE